MKLERVDRTLDSAALNILCVATARGSYLGRKRLEGDSTRVRAAVSKLSSCQGFEFESPFFIFYPTSWYSAIEASRRLTVLVIYEIAVQFSRFLWDSNIAN